MFQVKGFKDMAFPVVLLRIAEWILFKIWAKSLYRAATKVRNYNSFFRRNSSSTSLMRSSSHFPSVTKCCLHGRESQTVVCCDIHGCLLRSQSFFPFFMLIAFEGGGIFRAFLLLLSTPLLLLLNYTLKLRVMIFITFCGLRLKDMETVSRAVLPKFYLENLNLHVYEIIASAGSRMVFTSLPRVMVQGFLKEYLNVDTVRGTELHTVGQYYTGFLSASGLLLKRTALKELSAEKNMPDIAIGKSSSLHDHHSLLSLFKEAYVVFSKGEEGDESSRMPRHKYPKPLVFHDGRLAFLPTPFATLVMFIWLPVGILLAFIRLTIGIFFPYKFAVSMGCATGAQIRVEEVSSSSFPPQRSRNGGKGGVLYVCTHRTLLDPVILSAAVCKPVTAVTYSLSKMSEFLSPIRTVRLTRNRKKDGETMQRLLEEGDLVVCPEGTTCREPYLLRFSSLFAELADEIVPVAINTHVTMFYGTTASGLKCLDPIFFLMNPRPCYDIKILEKVPRELTVAGGKSSHEVANYIQRQLGDALGFECTSLTRRDKYLMLAGNEGFVQDDNTSNKSRLSTLQL